MTVSIGEDKANAGAAQPRVLFVDDEPMVLQSIERLLHGRYHLTFASSGIEALQFIETEAFEVVVSDLRMPELDGTELLKRVHLRCPDTMRMALTGHADLEAAASAINDGRVFRFLLKPIRKDALIAALEAALSQRRMMLAERELLEQTLSGCVDALTEALALTNPEAFGRSRRLRRLVGELAREANLSRCWVVEVAAALSQLGAITLPPEIAHRAATGAPLLASERTMVERARRVPSQLVRRVPRLEPVVALLDAMTIDDDLGSPLASREEKALRLAIELERQTAAGASVAAVLTELERGGNYDASLLGAARRIGSLAFGARPPRSLSIDAILPGMVLLEDVRTRAGGLLITRGNEVSDALLVRLRNFASTVGVREPLMVAVPDESCEQLRPAG